MKKQTLKKLILSSLFLAVGYVLPLLTGQIPAVGKALLPMHVPVLLCGFICGGPWGLLVGAVLPLTRALMFGMPPIYPTALAMTFELAAYGFFAGFFYRLFRRGTAAVFLSLPAAMIAGRLVWGAASAFLYGVGGKTFTLKLFWAGAVANAVPGIILQLVLIPAVLLALTKAKLIPLEGQMLRTAAKAPEKGAAEPPADDEPPAAE